ncbi:MAG TPA: c-type cytochrome biogenesis protein CcsB [Nitrospiraceae bacterium]|nr:c-type cytochrome biogenesis protein CcsB [Nitrospiraceae bacterium]
MVGVTATTIVVFGFIIQTIALLMRWVESYQMGIGRAPLANLYESLEFFVWSLILGYLIIEFKYKNRSLGAFVTPLAGLALAFIDVTGMSKDITPIVPALQSNWLLYHVLLSFLGYAGFGISFGAAVMYLIMATETRREKTYIFGSIITGVFLLVLIAMGLDHLSFRVVNPGDPTENYFFKATFGNPLGIVAVISYFASMAFIFTVWRFGLNLKKTLTGFSVSRDMLDEISYKGIVVGFPLFVLGALVMGAIWAEQAWGTYWSWDPKETWSLITAFVYALYLHARLMRGWMGKKVAIISIVGFISVIFTYLGVNLFLSGLHAYGGL